MRIGSRAFAIRQLPVIELSTILECGAAMAVGEVMRAVPGHRRIWSRRWVRG
jgi:hypothetical protein